MADLIVLLQMVLYLKVMRNIVFFLQVKTMQRRRDIDHAEAV